MFNFSEYIMKNRYGGICRKIATLLIIIIIIIITIIIIIIMV